MTTSPHQPALFCLKLDFPLDESLFPALLALVSEERRQRAGRFLRREDAWRSVLGEALARLCIGLREKCPPHEVRFALGEKEKPFAAGRLQDGLFNQALKTEFNISHSGEWVVCALDDRPVGIDVERIHAIDFAIAKRFFSAREYEDLTRFTGEAKTGRFFDYWTLKESYIKAIGRGLSCPLGSFTVVFESTRITMNAEGELPLLFFRQYDLGAGYKCALCASHEKFPEELVHIKLSELISPSSR
jgi:4'-phosphopantetheinyl transferase